MLSVNLILGAIALLCVSGLPAFLFSSKSQTGQRITTLLMISGAVMGLCGIGLAMGAVTPPSLFFQWALPLGQFSVKIDSVKYPVFKSDFYCTCTWFCLWSWILEAIGAS